jgi:hypothetical protein
MLLMFKLIRDLTLYVRVIVRRKLTHVIMANGGVIVRAYMLRIVVFYFLCEVFFFFVLP